MSSGSYTESWLGVGHYAMYEERRQYVTPVLGKIVGDTVGEYFDAGQTVLELGAGGGALRRYAAGSADALNWVESEHFQEPLDLPRAIETEKMIVKLPGIPLTDHSVGGIISLGVLDTLSDQDLEGTVNSAARVLEDGGHFVHLLDMTPDYTAEVKNARQKGMFPIPFNEADHGSTLGLHYLALKNLPRRIDHLDIDESTKRVFKSLVSDFEKHKAMLNRTAILPHIGGIAAQFGMVEQTVPNWLESLGTKLTERLDGAGLVIVKNEVITEELLVDECTLPREAQGKGATHVTRRQGVVTVERDEGALILPGKVRARADAQVLVAQKAA